MNLNQHIGTLTIRLILGFLFFLQGYGKVFTFGAENVYKNFFKTTYENLLPDFVVLFAAYFTTFAELICGFMLLIGLKRDWALYILAAVLVIVTFGHGLAETIWDPRNVIARAIFLIPLLLLPKEWDKFSIDYLIEKQSGSAE